MTRFRFWRNKESAGKFGFQRKNSIFFPLARKIFRQRVFLQFFLKIAKTVKMVLLLSFFFILISMQTSKLAKCHIPDILCVK